MVGLQRASLCLLIFGAFMASRGEGFHGRLGYVPGSSAPAKAVAPNVGTVSYYVAPVFYSQCSPWSSGPTVVPVPDAAPKYAKPGPALPSKPETPRGASDSRLPKITTTHSLAAALGSSRGSCSVGFWNFAGRDITLMIDGKSWSLPRNQVLTFEVDRQFTWQVPGQVEHLERVPDGQIAYEVIVRD